jgi:hypothetical protein
MVYVVYVYIFAHMQKHTVAQRLAQDVLHQVTDTNFQTFSGFIFMPLPSRPDDIFQLNSFKRNRIPVHCFFGYFP